MRDWNVASEAGLPCLPSGLKAEFGLALSFSSELTVCEGEGEVLGEVRRHVGVVVSRGWVPRTGHGRPADPPFTGWAPSLSGFTRCDVRNRSAD